MYRRSTVWVSWLSFLQNLKRFHKLKTCIPSLLTLEWTRMVPCITEFCLHCLPWLASKLRLGKTQKQKLTLWKVSACVRSYWKNRGPKIVLYQATTRNSSNKHTTLILSGKCLKKLLKQHRELLSSHGKNLERVVSSTVMDFIYVPKLSTCVTSLKKL